MAVWKMTGAMTGDYRKIRGENACEFIVEVEYEKDNVVPLQFWVPESALVNKELFAVKTDRVTIELKEHVVLYQSVYRPLSLRAIPASFVSADDAQSVAALKLADSDVLYGFVGQRAIPASGAQD